MGSSPTPSTSLRRHPKIIGERSEVEVIAALHRAGNGVYIAPFTDNARYDCVVDDGARLLRLQIKTARLTGNGCVRFDTASLNWNTRRRRLYHGEADLFAAYCPEIGKTYLLPVNDCRRRSAWLRLTLARNNQARGVRRATYYELKPRTQPRT
ncbi:MAG: group I intron-associated PD-(D/E)XK endonuclease [Gemmatimonadaceae bacterium]